MFATYLRGVAMQSVLITSTSRKIGYETALAFARAGYQVHATMRKPEQSPVLPETVACENLPITISAMDVNSDDSVRDAISGARTSPARAGLSSDPLAPAHCDALPDTATRDRSAPGAPRSAHPADRVSSGSPRSGAPCAHSPRSPRAPTR